METKIPLTKKYYNELYDTYADDIINMGRDLFGAKWDSWQLDLLVEYQKDITDMFFVRSSGHSVGKSYLSVICSLHTLLFKPDPGIVLTANNKAQLIGKLGRELIQQAQSSLVSNFFTTTTMKVYRNTMSGKPDVTAFIELAPNNENNAASFSGLHATNILFVADECSYLHPEIHQAILSSTSKQTEGASRRLLYFLNPLASHGVVYDIFHDPKIGKFWDKGHINSLDCEHSDHDYCNMLIDSYGWDSDIVRVRVRGEFPRTSSAQLISSEAIDNSVNRPLQKHDYGFDDVIMAVDVARYGDDRSVIMTRQGGYINAPKVFTGLSITELAGVVMDEVNQCYPRPTAIIVDSIGVGAGVFDTLHDRLGNMVKEFVGSRKSSAPEQFLNTRTETFVMLKRAIESDSIRLPANPELLEELRDIQYGYSAKMTLQIERKDLIKKRTGKSNDIADCCSMLFYNFDKLNAVRSVRTDIPRTVKVDYAW